jgi:DNA-binding transcriptional LysR family regulator
MNIRQLMYFVAIAEERNIGRAARRLNISQPPLTRQMQQLEDEVGAPLLLRTRRGVEVTIAGQVLLDDARALLSLAERAKERSRFAGQGQLGRLDIGVFGSSLLVLPDLLSSFHASHPRVDAAIHLMTKDAQIEALRNRRITVGFNLLGVRLSDIASEVLRSEPFVLAIGANDPLANKPTVSLSDLADRQLVLSSSGPRPNLVDVVSWLCRDAGFQPLVAQEVVDSVAAVALVAAGFGISLVPKSVSQLQMRQVIYRTLEGASQPSIDVHCIYRRDDSSPLLRAFLATLREARDQPVECAPLAGRLG